jgi:hypothetical protein
MDSTGAFLAIAFDRRILLRFQTGQLALELAVVSESPAVECAIFQSSADGAVRFVLVTAIAIAAAGRQVGDVGECR